MLSNRFSLSSLTLRWRNTSKKNIVNGNGLRRMVSTAIRWQERRRAILFSFPLPVSASMMVFSSVPSEAFTGHRLSIRSIPISHTVWNSTVLISTWPSEDFQVIVSAAVASVLSGSFLIFSRRLMFKSGAAMSQIILSPMWHYDRRGVMIVPNYKKSNLSFITIE